jgi:hypothetical protein
MMPLSLTNYDPSLLINIDKLSEQTIIILFFDFDLNLYLYDFLMEKTTKIENDHADEQIEVEGSSISSKSEEAGENDEFRKIPLMQSKGRSQ